MTYSLNLSWTFYSPEDYLFELNDRELPIRHRDQTSCSVLLCYMEFLWYWIQAHKSWKYSGGNFDLFYKKKKKKNKTKKRKPSRKDNYIIEILELL